MFVTNARLETEIKYLSMEIKSINDKYWTLLHKHERLMQHLGLHEVVHSGVEIRSKGSPGIGES